MVKVSVVMPVYNGEKYLQECIDSILCQSFQDFELLIINDGSTDHSIHIINEIKDCRVKLINNRHDFIDSLNKGMKMAQGKYIARMDADDRMSPERLAYQYELLEQRPDITVCASWLRTFGLQSNIWGSRKGKIGHPLVQMLRGNIIAHPTVMLRKQFLLTHDLQYEHYHYAEDFKLWSEVAKKNGAFYIIPEYLLDYRISDDQISRQKAEIQRNTKLGIQTEILEFLIGNSPKGQQDELINLYNAMGRFNEQGLLSEKMCFEVFLELFDNTFSNELIR